MNKSKNKLRNYKLESGMEMVMGFFLFIFTSFLIFIPFHTDPSPVLSLKILMTLALFPFPILSFGIFSHGLFQFLKEKKLYKYFLSKFKEALENNQLFFKNTDEKNLEILIKIDNSLFLYKKDSEGVYVYEFSSNGSRKNHQKSMIGYEINKIVQNFIQDQKTRKMRMDKIHLIKEIGAIMKNETKDKKSEESVENKNDRKTEGKTSW